MMRSLFHIGYHKTASTYLQESVFERLPGISKVPRNEIQEKLLCPGLFHYEPDQTRDWYLSHCASVRARGGRGLVLSDEELSGNIHTGGNGGYLAAEICGRLHQIDPQAHVLIVVRNQIDMIESVYRQYIQVGGTFGIRRYLLDNDGLPHRFPQFCWEHFEYDRLVAAYMTAFGTERVHIVLYEELLAGIDRVLKGQFAVGLSDIEDVQRNSRGRGNPSYSAPSVWLARLTNRLYGRDPVNRRTIIHVPYAYPLFRKLYGELDRAVGAFSGRRRHRFLSDRLANNCNERYRESNQRLAQIINRDLGRLGYPT